jgi:hypothetical protein
MGNNISTISKKRQIKEDEESSSKRKRFNRIPCNGIHDLCMNSKYKCCICMDKRIFEELYDGYVDGVGYVKNKTRFEHYCSSCKDKCQKC